MDSNRNRIFNLMKQMTTEDTNQLNATNDSYQHTDCVAASFRPLTGDSTMVVENFDMFTYGGNLYLMTSGYKPSSDMHYLQLSKLNSDIHQFIPLTRNSADPPYKQIGEGHGDSCNVIMYGGNLYIMYVSGDIGSAHKIVIRKFSIDGDGWSLDNDYRRITPAVNSQTSNIVQCWTASSDNYICLIAGLGTSIRSTNEYYRVYEKSAFMNCFLTHSNNVNADYGQNIFDNYCVFSGCDSGNSTMGMILTQGQKTIQGFTMNELLSSDDKLIIAAVVDNREDRVYHLVTVSTLPMYSRGSNPALQYRKFVGQDMSSFYLCDNVRQYDSNGSLLTWPLHFTNTVTDNFEFEGIKYLTGLEAYGLPGDWYFGLRTPVCNGYEEANETNALSWNQIIYKVTNPNATNAYTLNSSN